jgi:hypothetical protein
LRFAATPQKQAGTTIVPKTIAAARRGPLKPRMSSGKREARGPRSSGRSERQFLVCRWRSATRGAGSAPESRPQGSGRRRASSRRLPPSPQRQAPPARHSARRPASRRSADSGARHAPR